MKVNKRKAIIASIMAILVVAIGGTTWYVTTQRQANAPAVKKVDTPTERQEEIKKAERTNDGAIKQPMTKEGAATTAQAFLQAVDKSPDGKMTDDQRLDFLLKDPQNYKKALTEQAWSQVHLADFMNAPDGKGQTLTAQALIQVVSSIKKSGNKKVEISNLAEFSSIIYFDKESKTAFVPLDLFTTSATNLNLQFVYRDGKWLFVPYSLIAEINIRAVDQASQAENQPATKSTESSKK